MTEEELKEANDRVRRANELNAKVDNLSSIDFEFSSGSVAFSAERWTIGNPIQLKFAGYETIKLTDEETIAVESLVKSIIASKLTASKADFAAL